MIDENQILCRLGKTKYDSRIFDRLYRVFGTEGGGTNVSGYWEDELKAFIVNAPYMIIASLIENKAIGSLCQNYEWVEVPLREEARKDTPLDKLEITRDEKHNLADIAWFLKGYVASKSEDDPNDFGQCHVDVLIKVINGLK